MEDVIRDENGNIIRVMTDAEFDEAYSQAHPDDDDLDLDEWNEKFMMQASSVWQAIRNY